VTHAFVPKIMLALVVWVAIVAIAYAVGVA
jgi:hypothetical protein